MHVETGSAYLDEVTVGGGVGVEVRTAGIAGAVVGAAIGTTHRGVQCLPTLAPSITLRRQVLLVLDGQLVGLEAAGKWAISIPPVNKRLTCLKGVSTPPICFSRGGDLTFICKKT